MNTTSIFLSLLLFPALLHAQQAPPQGKGMHIQLKAAKAALVTPVQPVSVIEVMTNLPDSTTLGYGKQGEIMPDSNCTYWLQQYVNNQYTTAFAPQGANLLWVVKKLRINADVKNTDTYLFQFGADAYFSQDGKVYMPVCTVDTMLVGNATAGYENVIKDGIALLYKRSVSTRTVVTLEESIDKDQLIAGNRVKRTPILSAKQYTRGIYRNFQEFSRNSPSISNVLINHDQDGKVVLYEMGADSSQTVITNAWGLCFNNELYTLKNGTLIPLEKSGNSISLSKFRQLEHRQNQAIFEREFTTNRQPFDGQVILPVQLPAQRLQVEATRVDLETGELTF